MLMLSLVTLALLLLAGYLATEVDKYKGLPKPKFKVNDVVVLSSEGFALIECVLAKYTDKNSSVTYMIRTNSGRRLNVGEDEITCKASLADLYGDEKEERR